MQNARPHQTSEKSIKIIIVFFIFLLVSCADRTKKKPIVNHGFIDLSKWDFEADGMFDLKGDWKFKWNEDNPNFIGLDYDDSDWKIFSVPNNWNSRTKTSFGFCWLRLKIRLPQRNDLVLYGEPALSSSAFYINEEKKYEAGIAGNSREYSIPRRISNILPLSSDTTTCCIAWKISNYTLLLGGPTNSLRLGTMKQQLQKIKIENILFSLILGIVLMMSCYHFILLMERRNDKSNFYLFILCVIYFFRHLNFETEQILPLNPSYICAVRIKLECLLTVGLLPIILLYLNSLFQNNNSGHFRFFFYGAVVFTIFEALFVIFFPLWIFSRIFIVNHIFAGIWTIYILYITISAVIKKKPDSQYLLWVGSVLIVLIAYDVFGLYFRSFMMNNYISQYGFFIFLLFQSVLISKRYSSAFKKVEYLSHNLKQEVERQTVQLSSQKRELEYKNDRLKELDRYKTEFFQNVTHEFRTPLTLVLSPIDSIIEECGASLSEGVREHLNMVKRSAYQLLDLINQILDLSKIDAGMVQISYEKIDLTKLCTSVHTTFSSLATNKDITYRLLIPDDSITIRSDRDKIIRILSNLLSNAFKFTPKGGEIFMRISIISTPESSLPLYGESVQIDISDTGVGIPENELPHIFERFRQANGSSSRHFGGTGIGLALVKEYTKILGGTITLRSKPDKGSVFSVSLPLKMEISEDDTIHEKQVCVSQETSGCETRWKSGKIDCTIINTIPTGEQAVHNNTTYDSGKKIIYLLEDNQELLYHLKRCLEDRFNVFTARNGLQGLKKIGKLPQFPDLIVADIMMPGMDGLEFYRNIRENDAFLHIPVIFLTAKTEERLTALSLGAVDYICKPFDIHELIFKIESQLKVKAYQDQKITGKLREQIAAVFEQDEKISISDDLFDERCRSNNITEREKQIINLLHQGYTDKEIAHELFLSKYTVNTHLKNIFKKCRINSRIELINKLFGN